VARLRLIKQTHEKNIENNKSKEIRYIVYFISMGRKWKRIIKVRTIAQFKVKKIIIRRVKNKRKK
jgi:hypothetical protein